MPRPLVHVLVINWNGLEHLEECFHTLLQSPYPNVRYVLLDNASQDGSVRFVADRFGSDERVEIVECGANLGWSRGNNVGMARALDAGADYVFLLNNDTATDPGALEALVEMAETHPETGVLAPKMLLYDNPGLLNSIGLECSIIGSCWDRGLGRLDGPKWNERRPVTGACGGAMFIRSSVLRTTDLLPDFEIYLDDLDLCLAVWNAGYEVWTCPEAVVRHKFGATMGTGRRARRKYYLNTRNRFRLMLRNWPASALPSVAWAALVGECRAVGRALLNGETWKPWAHAKAWLSALAYFPTAMSERRRRRRAGMAVCRFWPLLRKDRLFFAGAEYPERGWYPPRIVNGREVRPIAQRAWFETTGGRLRVAHANCYPDLGATAIDLEVGGMPVAFLSTLDGGEVSVEVPSGRMDIVARRVFDADDTGECADYGGWLRIEPE